MFHFGFSYIGLIYLLMLFIPNIIWAKNQPWDYEKYAEKEGRVLQIIERVGVVLCTCAAVFSAVDIKFRSVWSIWLLISFLLLGVYEKNIVLLVSAIILGIGHIGIHWGHFKEISQG